MSSTGRDASEGGVPEIPELGTALHRNFPHRMVPSHSLELRAARAPAMVKAGTVPGSPGMTEQAAIALAAKAWPFEEARKLLDRIGGRTDRPVVFETGYGPSGLPHIGTFGEVVRTSMVRRAFAEISDLPTRLICFSDDMDGLRAVPDNIPEPARLAEAVGLPLARVPDPFGTHASFGAHNNARLRAFLDRFGFEYEFISALDQYQAGVFDELLLRVLERYDDVCEIVLPTLGAERRMTYSPFLPVSPSTGRVLQVPLKARDPARGTIAFTDENGEDVEIPVTGGHAKLQWRVDWAMRWVAFGVDYEMSGKDLIDSVRESSRIARVLEGVPPVGISYRAFPGCRRAENLQVKGQRAVGRGMAGLCAVGEPRLFHVCQTENRQASLS